MQIVCAVGLGLVLSFVVNKFIWGSMVKEFHFGALGELLSWLLIALPAGVVLAWVSL